jgi:hypothetical protein
MQPIIFVPGKSRFSNAARVSSRDIADCINMLTPHVPAHSIPYLKVHAQQLASKSSFGQSDMALIRNHLQMVAAKRAGGRLELSAIYLLYLELLAWGAKLNSMGDDAQLANEDLQNILQRQQQTLQMMSNISKKLYDTAHAVIRKLGG